MTSDRKSVSTASSRQEESGAGWVRRGAGSGRVGAEAGLVVAPPLGGSVGISKARLLLSSGKDGDLFFSVSSVFSFLTG